MLSRQYVKLCDLRDFEDPELIAEVASILPDREPLTHIERKVWEFAMVSLFLKETGRMHDGTEALSVGAGDERILFWLANRIGRVVATDVYGEGAFSDGSAQDSMLDNPAAHAPFPYREDRLEVQWMDARRLAFADASFDVVFTLSSIEHFGSPGDIARSAQEIGRVLKPGGHAVIVTECLVSLHPLDSAAANFGARLIARGRRHRTATPRRRSTLGEVFTARELQSRIVRPSGLTLMQQLDRTVSPQSWDNLTLLTPDGRLRSRTGDKHPMILIKVGRSVFTSVCLVLQKPG